MTKRQRIRIILSGVVNLALFIIGFIWFMKLVTNNLEEEFGGSGFELLKYFTVLSNLYLSLVCLACVIVSIISLIKNKMIINTILATFKFSATFGVALTMLTVLFFLGPTMGYGLMFKGYMLFFHLISPLIAIAAFFLLDQGGIRKWWNIFIGMVPFMIYGTVYLLNVLVFQTWTDHYGFNNGDFWWISLILMSAASLFISFDLHFLHNKIDDKISAICEKE